jgi:hypothetical protein
MLGTGEQMREGGERGTFNVAETRLLRDGERPVCPRVPSSPSPLLPESPPRVPPEFPSGNFCVVGIARRTQISPMEIGCRELSYERHSNLFHESFGRIVGAVQKSRAQATKRISISGWL